MEYDGSAAGTTRGRPHVCAEWGDAGEEDDHAVAAYVGGGDGVAEGECML